MLKDDEEVGSRAVKTRLSQTLDGTVFCSKGSLFLAYGCGEPISSQAICVTSSNVRAEENDPVKTIKTRDEKPLSVPVPTKTICSRRMRWT